VTEPERHRPRQGPSSSLVSKVSRTALRQRDNQAGRAPHWRPLITRGHKAERGGNGLTDGKHLGCGRPEITFASVLWSGGSTRQPPSRVAARLARLLVVSWGSLRVTLGGPGSGAPHGRSSSRWVDHPFFFYAGVSTGERQRVLRHKSGWGQSPGALTDVFVVVTRYREVPSHP
jgi:hypothetical protein